MFLRRPYIPDGETEGEFVVETCVREERAAARVDAVHDRLVQRIFTHGTETDKPERHRGHQFPIRRFINPRCKQTRESTVFTDARREALVSEVTHHHPQL